MQTSDSLDLTGGHDPEELLQASFRQVDAFAGLSSTVSRLPPELFSQLWHAVGLCYGHQRVARPLPTAELIQRALVEVDPPALEDAQDSILVRALLREFGHFAVSFHEALLTVAAGRKIVYLHAFQDATDYVYRSFSRGSDGAADTVKAVG